MKGFIIIIVAATLFVGCTRPELTKARIFERKETADNFIIISYQYAFNNKVYTDSATIKNRVLASDSIDVFVDPKRPEKAVPDFND